MSEIRSKPSTDAYRETWERAFNKPRCESLIEACGFHDADLCDSLAECAAQCFKKENPVAAKQPAAAEIVPIDVLGHGNCPDCDWFGQPEGCSAERDSPLCSLNKKPRVNRSGDLGMMFKMDATDGEDN